MSKRKTWSLDKSRINISPPLIKFDGAAANENAKLVVTMDNVPERFAMNFLPETDKKSTKEVQPLFGSLRMTECATFGPAVLLNGFNDKKATNNKNQKQEEHLFCSVMQYQDAEGKVIELKDIKDAMRADKKPVFRDVSISDIPVVELAPEVIQHVIKSIQVHFSPSDESIPLTVVDGKFLPRLPSAVNVRNAVYNTKVEFASEDKRRAISLTFKVKIPSEEKVECVLGQVANEEGVDVDPCYTRLPKLDKQFVIPAKTYVSGFYTLSGLLATVELDGKYAGVTIQPSFQLVGAVIGDLQGVPIPKINDHDSIMTFIQSEVGKECPERYSNPNFEVPQALPSNEQNSEEPDEEQPEQPVKKKHKNKKSAKKAQSD